MRQYHQKIGDPEKRAPDVAIVDSDYDFIIVGKLTLIKYICKKKFL
jgi:hypothetical protein